jgi:hypothetical protein
VRRSKVRVAGGIVRCVSICSMIAVMAGPCAWGQSNGDHLVCHKIKDSQPKQVYSADVTGLLAAPGCLIKVPATQLCVAATDSNVTPMPPGDGAGTAAAGRFLCYKLKCPKATFAPITVADEFGTRAVTPAAPKVFCAPEAETVTTSTLATTTTTTLPSTCGNGIVDPGETCDGNCPTCGAEPTSCFTHTGSATTCDLVCHVPIQTCAAGDTCCPYVAGGGGAQCNASTDADCAGTSWRYREITWAPGSWAAGQTPSVLVYGISQGDSVLFTTCTPDGSSNTTDTAIVSVVDQQGSQLVGSSDDSQDAGVLPRLAGWNCATKPGFFALSTAPPNDGGVIVGPNSFRLTVSYGSFGGGAGSAKLYIWWNGSSNPNPG